VDALIRVMLMTIYPLWAEACCRVLEGQPRIAGVTTLVADANPGVAITHALTCDPDVAVVSLDMPSEGLILARLLRDSGYDGGLLVIYSHLAPPSLEELAEAQVQSIVSSLASVHDLASSVYALADRQPEPLEQQYLRATGALTHKPGGRNDLSEREKEVLQLVAADLTDHEIAERLQVSVRTVSNQLHYIYAKLGVRGRAGAVFAALNKGLIRLSR
jgi:DNA-binding NarL/FixJ family response regulator